MANSRVDLLVALNPWQTMMAAMLYSVTQNLSEVPLLVWDPQALKSYSKLKNLSAEIKDASSELEGLLPITSEEFFMQIEARLFSFLHSANESKQLVSRLQPKRLLILTDSPPVPSFWQTVPEDTEVHFLAWDNNRQPIEQLLEDITFKKFNPSIGWISSPKTLIAKLWEEINHTPFPVKTEAIVASNTPKGILTGMFQAKKEKIPLIVARIYGQEEHSMIAKIMIEDSQDVNLGNPLQEYEEIKTAQLCDTPRFNCILEEETSLDFVATIIRSFEQGGQVILKQPLSDEVKEEARNCVKQISTLMMSDSIDKAYQELHHLSKLVTKQIPDFIQDILNESPNAPVQIVGTPFPYSLCRTLNDAHNWAETYSLAFLPLPYASKIFLRNFNEQELGDVEQLKLCAIIDSLAPRLETETDFVIKNLRSKGAYCIKLTGPKADVKTVKSVLNYIPINICLLTSHGSEKALTLTDGFLFSDEIKALSLKGRPFIINNSCLSWTGVGSAFIEGRAKGFVGTYWTIENRLATKIAQDLILQLLEGNPASKALQNVVQKNPHSLTHLAYIFVGLFDTRLPINQLSNSEEMEDLAKLEILSQAGQAALYEHDISSALALWSILDIEEELDSVKLSPQMASELALAKFNYLLGISDYDERITPNVLIAEGLKAVKVIQQGGSETKLYRILSHLGMAYLLRRNSQKGDLEEAEQYFIKALDIEQRLGHRDSVARELGNLGHLYDYKEDYVKAMEYHQQALAINKETHNTRDWVLDLQNIAMDYLAIGNLSSSLQYAQEALNLHNSVYDFRLQRLHFCLQLARELMNKNYYELAEEYADKAIQDLLKVEQGFTIIEASFLIDGFSIRAKYFEALGNIQEAERYYELAAEMAQKANLLERYFILKFMRIDLIRKVGQDHEAQKQAVDLISTLEASEDQLDPKLFTYFTNHLKEILT